MYIRTARKYNSAVKRAIAVTNNILSHLCAKAVTEQKQRCVTFRVNVWWKITAFLCGSLNNIVYVCRQCRPSVFTVFAKIHRNSFSGNIFCELLVVFRHFAKPVNYLYFRLFVIWKPFLAVHSLVFKFLCSHKILRKNKAGIFSLLSACRKSPFL